MDSHCLADILREFVFANERHPESVRVFPWLRPAGGDFGSAESAGIIWRVFKMSAIYSEIDFNLPNKSMNSKILYEF